MYIPLNEVSIHDDFYTKQSYESKNRIILDFIGIIREAKIKKVFDGLLYNHNINIEFSSFFSNWLNDSSVKKEDKSLLRIFLGTFISFVETPLAETSIVIDGITYNSKGAGIAIDNNCDFIVNLKSHCEWEKNNKNFDYETFIKDELIHSKKEVSQIFDIQSLQCLLVLEKENKYKSISSGQDLWEQWDELFPNLIKCENVKNCLYRDPEKNHIEKVIEQLNLLQQYFSSLKNSFSLNELKKLGIDVSDESDTVKKNQKLKKVRFFKLPDGSKEYFYYHTKFFGKFESRLYFLPISNSSKCYIGYIGRHLPTAKNK